MTRIGIAVFESRQEQTVIFPARNTEVFELHQLAREFGEERIHRDRFEAYCREYYRMAQTHREEHAEMKAELNLLTLFSRKGVLKE